MNPSSKIIKFVLLVFVVTQLSGCFGNTIATGSFIELPLEGARFDGKAYMLTAEDMTRSIQINEKLVRILMVDDATEDEEFEAVLSFLNTSPFSELKDDQLEQQINELRQIFVSAAPQFQALMDERVEKFKVDLLSREENLVTETERLKGYNLFIQKELEQVALIEKQIDDNLSQMAILKDQAMHYMNQVIVDEELPLAKIKTTGGMANPNENIKNIFQIKYGYFPEGTKDFKYWEKYEIKYPEKRKFISEVNGKRYRIPLNGKSFALIIDTPKHKDFLLPLYIQFAELAWISTAEGARKAEASLLPKLREAKRALKKRELIAGNKFDVESISRLEQLVSQIKSSIEITKNNIVNPERRGEKAKFTSTLTKQTKTELSRSLRSLLAQVTTFFYDSIENTSQLSSDDDFDIPKDTLVVGIHGKIQLPNLFTGQPTTSDVFRLLKLQDYNLEDKIKLSFSRFNERSDFQRINDVAKLSKSVLVGE